MSWLAGVVQWPASVALLLAGLVAYGRGWVVSAAQHRREMKQKDELCEFYKQQASTERERADVERQRADTATASLAGLATQLPEALRQLKAAS